MNVWSKLIDALRGGLGEAGDALVDSQALRILDQEIRDADQALRQAREALAGVMARQKLADERAAQCQAKVEEYEGYALKALESGNEALAREVAEKIAELEAQCQSERDQAEGFSAQVAQLRKAVTQAEANIRHLKQQVDTVKATESVQRAQQAVAQRQGDTHSRLGTALDSLERLKRQQAERAARLEAADELASAERGDDLEARLRAAGIATGPSSADSVLARLRDKR